MHERIQFLKDKDGDTVPDPWDSTLVFSSLALLWNITFCHTLDYNVTASSDGTDHILCNNHILLNFGVHSINESGTRSFRPLFYAVAPSEKEIYFAIAMVTFLKCVRRLFGLQDFPFNGLIVSDCTGVFVNVFLMAFPSCLLGQCYPHILRKFLIGTKGEFCHSISAVLLHQLMPFFSFNSPTFCDPSTVFLGNGDYQKHAVNKSFLSKTASRDVRHLYECRTKEMFYLYAGLVKQAWIDMGEKKIQSVFFNSYVDQSSANNYNTWYCCASGVPGCTPGNNPNERSNQEIKGTRTCTGACAVGKSFGTMLAHEFPKLIHDFSLRKVGVERHLSVHIHSSVMDKQSKRFQELLLYTDLVDDSLDYFFCNESGVDVIYINTEHFVGNNVTRKRIKEYRQVLKGQSDLGHKQRNVVFEQVSSLCRVAAHRDSDGRIKHTGACPDFFNKTYCHHCAYFQYKDELVRLCHEIPTARRRSTTYRHRFSSSQKHDLRSICRASQSRIHRSLQLLITHTPQSELVPMVAQIPDLNLFSRKVDDRMEHLQVSIKMKTANRVTTETIDLEAGVHELVNSSHKRQKRLSNELVMVIRDLKRCVKLLCRKIKSK